LGSAVVSTAVFGVSPKTLPSLGPAPNGVGRVIVRLAGETPTRATGTVALPDPSASFRLKLTLAQKPLIFIVRADPKPQEMAIIKSCKGAET
jgi:hypothetical protein